MANAKVCVIVNKNPIEFENNMNRALDGFREKGYIITDIQYGGYSGGSSYSGNVYSAMIVYAPPQKA